MTEQGTANASRERNRAGPQGGGGGFGPGELGLGGGTPADPGSPHVAGGPDTSNCGDGIEGAGLSAEADYTDLGIAGIYYNELGGFGD